MTRRDCTHFDHPFKDEATELCWERFERTGSATIVFNCGKCTCFREAIDKELEVKTYPSTDNTDIPF